MARGIDRRRQPRVGMMTERTRKNGSSRVICYQYEEQLHRAGIDVDFYPPSSIGVYELFYERVTHPRWLVLLLKAIYWYVLVLPRRLLQIAKSCTYDIVFIQRGLLNYDSLPLLELLTWALAKKVFRRVLVYALDDAQYLVVPAGYFRLRCRLADWVFTGNDEIADFARANNPQVMVFEATVDTERYQPREHREHLPVIIGWAGTIVDDSPPLRLVENALARVTGDRAVLEVVSNRDYVPCVSGVRVVNRRWTLEGELENLRRFDIGIMPLEFSDYARGKEGYKIKQYFATGLPVVCTPVGKNKEIVRHGVNGFYASTEDEWVDFLMLLIDDWRLREHIGGAGRLEVEKRFSLPARGPHFADWLWRIYLQNPHRLKDGYI